ncbi:MAG: hypothetical protein DRH26_05325 [Deltaproteobacteria bacterium]|nr:MAG: hypothetical protein DRH26_05325 [Deltaproteobacteria bacterium]
MIGNGNPIGSMNGFVQVPYTLGENTILDHLNTSYYHVHGQSFVYPDHANSVTLTAGTGAWDLTGTIIEVVPAGTLIASSFDLHWMNISAISGNGEIQIDIFKGLGGSEVKVGATRSQRNTNQSRENANRIQIPQQESGERISCRLYDSTSGALTCAVSFEGHFYTG